MIPPSGAIHAHIIFDSFGEGENPVRDGADQIKGWTSRGGLAWSAPTHGVLPKQVFFNDVRGEHPNSIGALRGIGSWFSTPESIIVSSLSTPDSLSAGFVTELSVRDNLIYRSQPL